MYGSLRGDSESVLGVLAAVVSLGQGLQKDMLLEGWLEAGKGSCQWHLTVCHVGETPHTGGLLDQAVKYQLGQGET